MAGEVEENVEEVKLHARPLHDQLLQCDHAEVNARLKPSAITTTTALPTNSVNRHTSCYNMDKERWREFATKLCRGDALLTSLCSCMR